MRPLYETKQNEIEERAVAEYVAKSRGVTVTKLPKKHSFDYLATSYDPSVDRIRHTLLEIKCRTCRRQESPYMILSALKVIRARQFWDSFAIPTIIVFRFSDGEVASHTLVMKSDYYDVVMHGRKDRGDRLDIEPVIRLNTATLKSWGMMQ